MRLLGQILLACLLIAVLQGILAVLAVAIVLALIAGLIWRPAETISLLLLLLYLRTLEIFGWYTVGGTIALAIIVLIARRRKSAAGVPADPVALLARGSATAER